MPEFTRSGARVITLVAMGLRPPPRWRPVLLDGALAVFFFVIAMPTWAARDHRAVPLVIGLIAPLAVRRRYPVQVFVVISLTAFVQWLVQLKVGTCDLGFMVALYTVAAYRSRRWSVPALGIGLLGTLLAWISAWQDRRVPPYGLVAPTVIMVAVWIVGMNMHARRRYLAELEQRAARLEREQDALARAAVAEERARIAREMHDVVAHTVAVMVAQAEGAAVSVRAKPQQAEAALEVISEAGRSALGELRRMLGVLREQGSGARTAPQPDAGDLDTLIASMRTAGLPVRFTCEGNQLPLDPGLELAVYRIVQESLTNVIKHCGPQVPTDVLLRRNLDQVEVEVVNLRAADHPGPLGPQPAAAGPGHGLFGMRERVTMFAGDLSAGPTPSGGWRVSAVLPTSEPAA